MAARRRMGVKRREMAMVGDQLYADRIGVPHLLFAGSPRFLGILLSSH